MSISRDYGKEQAFTKTDFDSLINLLIQIGSDTKTALATNTDYQDLEFIFELFTHVWDFEDINLKKHPNRKYKLNAKTRKQIEDGIDFLKNYFDKLKKENQKKFEEAKEEEKELHNKKTQLRKSELMALIMNANQAINGYLTPGQKALKMTGEVLGGILAVSFGLIETGITVMMMLTGLSFMASASIWVIRATSWFLGAVSSWMMWRVYGEKMPKYLIKIFGKDEYYEGFNKKVKWVQGKGITSIDLTSTQKAHLWIFTIGFAIPASIASATGTWLLATSMLPALFGVSAMFFPPAFVGILVSIAAVVVVLRMKAGFHKFLCELSQENRSLKDYLLKPFNDIQKELDENEVLQDHPKFKKAAKIFSYLVSGILILTGLLGLGYLCYANKGTVEQMAVNQLGAKKSVATYLGYAIGMGVTFIARGFFTFGDIAKTAYKSCVSLFTKKNVGQFNKVEFAAVITDAALEGIFYFAFLKNMTGKTNAALGAGFSALRNFETGYASIYENAKNPKPGIDAQVNSIGEKYEVTNDNSFGEFKYYFNEAYKAKGSLQTSEMKDLLDSGAIKTIEEVKEFVLRKPQSRSAQIYYAFCQENQALPTTSKPTILEKFYQQYKLTLANSGFFSKSGMNGLLDKAEIKTVEDLENYAKANPKSRTAQIYYDVCLKEELELKKPDDFKVFNLKFRLLFAKSGFFGTSKMLTKLNAGEIKTVKDIYNHVSTHNGRSKNLWDKLTKKPEPAEEKSRTMSMS